MPTDPGSPTGEDSSNGEGDHTPRPSSDELADRVDELESVIRDLRRETLEPPRGPLGLPRPPTPREFVDFTDRYAIPATIAFLEANIRALQALQAALRLARGADDTRETAITARDRTIDLGTRTLDALDTALDDLQAAYREGALPNDEDARRILEDARSLTDEIRVELDDASGPGRHRRVDTDDDGAGPSTNTERPLDPRVDPEEVETELDVLRDEFNDTDESPDDTDSPDGTGSPDDDSDSGGDEPRGSGSGEERR